MYCSSCGAELIQEVSYCNRCGANLKPVSNQTIIAPTKLVGATWAIPIAMALVTLGGFALVFSIVMSLIDRGIKLEEGPMVLVIFSLVIVLFIDMLLARQLSRVISMPQLPEEPSKSKKSKPVEKIRPQQLSAPREPVMSVTEHTTRTFEPVYKERDTQR
jgi:hypothetical protein